MNAQLDNKLTSAMAVKRIGEKYNDIIAATPALRKAYDDHNALVQLIQEKRPDSEKSTKGPTGAKDNAKQQLAQLDVEITSALGAMAHDTKNDTLKAQCDYSTSDFLYVRSGLLLDRSRLIYQLALDNLEILKADYAVTDEDLTTMKSLIDNFDELDTAPLQAKIEKKDINASLRSLFKDLYLLYKDRLDKLMKKQQSTQPVFYSAYFNARNIVNLGVRHEKEEDTVTTKATEEMAKG